MANKKIVQIPVTLTSMSNTKDGGKRVGFMTQELSIDEKLILEQFYGVFGWLLFSENKLKEEDIPKEDAKTEGKTPSQRLRSVLFVLWQQTKREGDEDFEAFYRSRVNQLVEQIKKKLD